MKRLILALLSGGSLIAIATGANAQQAAAEPAQVEEIVVTGSRVIQNGFEAPTPVTVLSAESLDQHAAPSIPEALRELPSLLKTTGPRAAPTASTADPNASAGTYLNLRNLGSQRMLLLMDGMRVPPTRSNGLTDANVIPQMLVSRVEVVTGGASAAYGSDAVSGVVNYIMDNHFTGIKGVVQGAVSQRNDANNYRIGLAGGTSLGDDRLHIVGSAEYRNDDGIHDQCQRQWGCDGYLVGGVNGSTGAGSATNPYVIYSGARVARVTADGYIAAVTNANGSANATANTQLANRNLVYQPGGAVLVPYNVGTLISPSVCINCGGAIYADDLITLVPRQITSQFYGRAEYELTPDIKVWAQANFGRSRVRETLVNETWFGASGVTIPIFTGNAFLSPAVQAVLTSTGANTIQLDTYRNPDRGDLENVNFDGLAQNRSVTIGAEGKFWDDWAWKAYAVDSESKLKSSGKTIENAQFYAALDAVRDPSGTIVCRVTITNPGLYPGCVPINMFGVGSPSQAAKNYVFGQHVETQTTTLKGFGGQVTGSPFSTWAGPVAMAVGAEWRKQALDVVSNAADPIVTTGIRYGNASTLRFRTNNVSPTTGSYTVGEVFGEADAPLLQDFSLGDVSVARRLSINGAVRFTDYSTSGNVYSWKVGGSWMVNDDMRFRVTRSRDVRAPTLDDFFAPVSSSFATFTDLHTNNTFALVNTISRGNLNLKPEKADTTTLGAVLTPSFLPDFTTSIDWYSIDVSNAIQSFGGTQLVQACEASNGLSALCSGVVRPLPFSDRTSANFPSLIYAQSFNAVELIAKGLDVEAAYKWDLLGGQLKLGALATYQYDYESQSSPITPLVNSAGYNTSPKLVMSVSVGYKNGPVGVDVRTRRIGSWSQAAPPGTTGTINYYQNPEIGAVYYTDVAMTYDIEVASMKRVQAFVNVGNLFDRKPPLIPFNSSPGVNYPTARSLYDVVLREFSAGVRFQY